MIPESRMVAELQGIMRHVNSLKRLSILVMATQEILHLCSTVGDGSGMGVAMFGNIGTDNVVEGTAAVIVSLIPLESLLPPSPCGKPPPPKLTQPSPLQSPSPSA